jgi:Holliday junction resolvasome RuvABC ATP-dependent DNA helicase subunit
MARRTTIRSDDSADDRDNVIHSSSPIIPDPSGLCLDDFAATEVLLKLVRYRIDQTKKKKIPLMHHVFSGCRGLGKRTLAALIARAAQRATHLIDVNGL